MKIIAFNGSPRKEWNTAMLLEKALEGAASQGAETELIHLYDLDFKGCRSCFACKTKGGKSYGRCAVMDDLAPILKNVEDVDAIILGSPIYFGTVTGEMRSFVERLMFPYRPYADPRDPQQSLFPKKINTGFIYTMNATQEQMREWEFDQHPRFNERILKLIFGASESLFSFDTYQFEDYSKVVADRFDPEKKAKRRKVVFPKDCQKAFEMGARFARKNEIMIRKCKQSEFEMIDEIINDAAQSYKGAIPVDCWHEPYMSREQLKKEIEQGVVFWGFEKDGKLVAVMGIQDKGDVNLIRHAYVKTHLQNQGIGTRLLQHLESRGDKPILIGTWADAGWAIAFYQKNGYRLVTQAEKDKLLGKYWSIPTRQVQSSVVLANRKWVDAR